MNLSRLEVEIGNLSEKSCFTETDLLMYPEKFRKVHSFQLFGDDLLAIPASLVIEGDDEEFEIPFSFTADLETIKLFESEFRSEIPTEFVQIGNLSGSTEIVLLNMRTDGIHVFHVSDISDHDWLKYKLENEICDLTTFIDNLRPQTVCCLMDPNDFSKWDFFEIRNEIELKTDEALLKFRNADETWAEYKSFVKKSMANGYEIHYAPKKLKIAL